MIEKVAISIWNNRISPVMDTACHLLLVEICDGHEVFRENVGIPAGNPQDLVNLLTRLEVQALICGAISCRLEKMLVASGIRPYPWCRGDIDEIIAAYMSGILQDGHYLLPGRRRRHQGQGRRCSREVGFRRYHLLKEEQ